MTADEIIQLLGLEPHPEEGGYFRETYRSQQNFANFLPGKDKSLGTAIYYLLTETTFSCLHKLCTDEIYHFYLGDPVEMLWLLPDGTGQTQVLGPDLQAGEKVQLVVPKGVWQGSHLKPGLGRHGFALLGCTMAPGFDYSDYEEGKRADLAQKYAQFTGLIAQLTRN